MIALAALLCAAGAAEVAAAGDAALAPGHLYAAQFAAGGAHVAVWRYHAEGSRHGAPVVLFGELGFSHEIFDPGLAPSLQERGREVFAPDWRGTGRSAPGPAALGGLDSLVEGEARAALDAALRETAAPCAHLIGFGLGGVAAYLLADRACTVVAVSVPARWEVPNEAARLLLAAVRARPAPAEAFGKVAGFLSLPSPFDPLERRDLFTLFLGLAPEAPLRHAAGRVAPQLLRDLASLAEGGAWAARVAAAADAVRVPLLIATAPRDNLVHPEHALALSAPHDLIVLSRLEGFDEEHAHLPIPRTLARPIADWLDAHEPPRGPAHAPAHAGLRQ